MSFSEGLLSLVNKCNNFPTSGSLKTCGKFFVKGHQVGLIREDFLKHLKKYPEVFVFKQTEQTEVHLSDSLQTPQEATDAVEKVLQKCRSENIFLTLAGWRDERYDVKQTFSSPTLLKMERAATCIFGLLQYGTHVNGYTYGEDGNLLMWISRRSPTKPTWPGKLDNISAGGLSSGYNVQECVIKECQEEASISLDHLKKLKPVGSVSYFYEDERGIFPETQFLFDLELPSDFSPVNADGEVADFKLMSIEEVKKLIITSDFKPNCALIILDFLIRHGFISPDKEPNYTLLIESMHYPLQSTFMK